MPTVQINQEPDLVSVSVSIEIDSTDDQHHDLQVRTNDDFSWIVPLTVNTPSSDNMGVTVLGPHSTEIIVFWDGKEIARQPIKEAGEGPKLTAKYEVV